MQHAKLSLIKSGLVTNNFYVDNCSCDNFTGLVEKEVDCLNVVTVFAEKLASWHL